MASFHLHQSAENFLRTIPITFILYGHKSHDLSELMNAAKKHTPEIFKAFPRDTPEEKRLFDLLQRAYIESRYNPDFEITKADIDALLPRSSCCATWWSRSATNGWPTTTAGSRNKRIPQVSGNVCPSLLSPDHSSAPGQTKLHRRHYRFPRPRIQYSI